MLTIAAQQTYLLHGKNGFVTATKLGITNKIYVATKNFAAATKRFVDRTKHFFVLTKYLCYPYAFANDFVGITKPFFPCPFVALANLLVATANVSNGC